MNQNLIKFFFPAQKVTLIKAHLSTAYAVKEQSSLLNYEHIEEENFPEIHRMKY